MSLQYIYPYTVPAWYTVCQGLHPIDVEKLRRFVTIHPTNIFSGHIEWNTK